MTQRKYAGIGSRRTPQNVCDHMTKIAQHLQARDWLLRSGGADGADSAFAKEIADANKLILHPKTHVASQEAFEIAERHHPAWHVCSPYGRKLLARNVTILLGEELDDHVEFVAFWLPPSTTRGGTLHGLHVASTYKIPTFPVEQIVDIGEWADNL